MSESGSARESGRAIGRVPETVCGAASRDPWPENEAAHRPTPLSIRPVDKVIHGWAAIEDSQGEDYYG